MFRPLSVLFFLLSVVIFTAAVFGSTVLECPTIVSDSALMEPLDWPTDVRIETQHADSFRVLSPFTGLFRIGIANGKLTEPVQLSTTGAGPTQLLYPYRFGLSYELEVVATFISSLYWREHGSDHWAKDPFVMPLDMDVYQDKILILGVQDGSAVSGPDTKGEIAHLGSPKDGVLQFKKILFSVFGPTSQLIYRCGALGLGVVRFLPDGTGVLVPAFEPGVYLVDGDGKLLETWSSTALGLNTVCSYAEKIMMRARIDEPFRWQLIRDRGSLAEEVLPHPDGGFVVVLREAEGKGSAWVLAHLRSGQERASFCRLPITSKQPYAHLRGDVTEDGLVFLLSYDGYSPENRKPPERPRLIVMRWPE